MFMVLINEKKRRIFTNIIGLRVERKLLVRNGFDWRV